MADQLSWLFKVIDNLSAPVDKMAASLDRMEKSLGVASTKLEQIDKSRTEGNDPITVKLDLHIMNIDHNGVASVTPIDTQGT